MSNKIRIRFSFAHIQKKTYPILFYMLLPTNTVECGCIMREQVEDQESLQTMSLVSIHIMTQAWLDFMNIYVRISTNPGAPTLFFLNGKNITLISLIAQQQNNQNCWLGKPDTVRLLIQNLKAQPLLLRLISLIIYNYMYILNLLLKVSVSFFVCYY